MKIGHEKRTLGKKVKLVFLQMGFHLFTSIGTYILHILIEFQQGRTNNYYFIKINVRSGNVRHMEKAGKGPVGCKLDILY